MWQVCLELNVPSLFAVGADPGDPQLRADSVPQGPKQSSYLRNRPVMRLRRPAMSVAREGMVRILVMQLEKEKAFPFFCGKTQNQGTPSMAEAVVRPTLARARPPRLLRHQLYYVAGAVALSAALCGFVQRSGGSIELERRELGVDVSALEQEASQGLPYSQPRSRLSMIDVVPARMQELYDTPSGASHGSALLCALVA